MECLLVLHSNHIFKYCASASPSAATEGRLEFVSPSDPWWAELSVNFDLAEQFFDSSAASQMRYPAKTEYYRLNIRLLLRTESPETATLVWKGIPSSMASSSIFLTGDSGDTTIC